MTDRQTGPAPGRSPRQIRRATRFDRHTLRLAAALVLAGAIGLVPASLPQPAAASGDLPRRVLEVGPGRAYPVPSAAAAAARDGDVIRIDAGDYADCAVWRADRLVLEARGGPVRVHDEVCQDKAIWVIGGDDITVSGITFTGARSTSHNGAGIRAEGRTLTILASRFIDNENGILAASVEGSTILIDRSLFLRNGSCVDACAHGIYVNRIDRLRVQNSTFREQFAGHHIKSRALVTEVVGSVIEDGPVGTASYLIDVPDGGSVLITGNRLSKGIASDNPGTAIAIGAESNDNPGRGVLIAGNTFENDFLRDVVFVRNNSPVPAVLEGNRLRGRVVPLQGPGEVAS